MKLLEMVINVNSNLIYIFYIILSKFMITFNWKWQYLVNVYIIVSKKVHIFI